MGLLFISQVICEHEEPWWNDTHKGKRERVHIHHVLRLQCLMFDISRVTNLRRKKFRTCHGFTPSLALETKAVSGA
jgi:hypothetical protein